MFPKVMKLDNKDKVHVVSRLTILHQFCKCIHTAIFINLIIQQ